MWFCQYCVPLWPGAQSEYLKIYSRGFYSGHIDNKIVIGGSLESPWWLIGGFCPNILGPWWGPTKSFCSSVNVHGVMVLFSGGGDM